MRIGVPTEIKDDEYRVALTPAGVRELTDRGHEVVVQAGAGEGSAIGDDQYVLRPVKAQRSAVLVLDQSRRTSDCGVRSHSRRDFVVLHGGLAEKPVRDWIWTIVSGRCSRKNHYASAAQSVVNTIQHTNSSRTMIGSFRDAPCIRMRRD